MNRKDRYIGPLHIIVRKYSEPQYGYLLWDQTLDIWLRRTVLTLRWVR